MGFLFLGAAMATTETKTQRVERLKREKNPWQAFDELRNCAEKGFPAIPPEWLGTYLRWWGVYTQGDGAGVVGGKNGEGKAVPFFMVRIRIPNGQISAAQMRVVAELSRRFGRGVADITVRQNIQLHWIPAESLPEVLTTLDKNGLTSLGACGDVVRNITGCPVAGLDADEICDTLPLAQEASRFLAGNAEFYNLPRKFKVSLTGCPAWCSYPEINDVGLTATVRRAQGEGRSHGGESQDKDEIGFSLRVGGGLSADPHLAVRLNAFVRWDQAVDVVRAVATLFRESTVLREHRERARLKFLFLREGWSADDFQRELEKKLGYALDPAEPETAPEDVYRDHVGIHRQKQVSLCYMGATVLRGRLTWEQLHAAAELAERFADGQLRTTSMQNLIVVNVPRKSAPLLAKELEAIGLPIHASPFVRGTVACTGTEFCKLAITETKGFARWLTEELDERVPGFEQHLKIHIAGCPNSCGQHAIADIGLEGKKLIVNGAMTDAFYFCLGGSVGAFQTIGRPVGYRCSAQDVPESIARVLHQYQASQTPGENLRQFFARHSDVELRQLLAGGTFEPVQRDLPTAPVPHSVEG
jgi:sulfite reductase (ferredoxin)